MILFQLLFFGRHPFSGNYLGKKDKTLEDCIREHLFAYGENPRVEKPPGTLSLSDLPPKIAGFFEQAFSGNSEATERQSNGLKSSADLSKNLKRCEMHPGHHYFSELRSCPWCRIEGQTGLLLFPLILSSNGSREKVDLFTIENLIKSFPEPIKANSLFSEPTELPAPSRSLIEENRALKRWQLMVGGIFFAATCLIFLLLGFEFSTWLFFVLLIPFAVFASKSGELKNEVSAKLASAEEDWASLRERWASELDSSKLKSEVAQIRSLAKKYERLQWEGSRKLLAAGDSIQRESLANYLKSQKVIDADTFQLSEADKYRVHEIGIESAFDIHAHRLKSNTNLEHGLIEKLIDWRRDVESEFTPGPDSSKNTPTKTRVLANIENRKRSTEKEIEDLTRIARSHSSKLHFEQKKLIRERDKAANKLSQLRADLAAVTTVYLPAGLLAGAAIFVALGSVFFATKPSAPPTVVRIHENENQYGSGYSLEDDAIKRRRGSSKNLPRENITDNEIQKLSLSERKEYANALYLDSFNYLDGASWKAEQRLRLALRFEKDNLDVLNHLGNILHNRKRYQESISVFERSLKIDDTSYAVKVFIAVNLIELKNYPRAKRILREVTKNSTLFEGFYNYGLVCNRLKDYKTAKKALTRANEIKLDDPDTLYLLGIASHGLKDKEGFLIYYEKLIRLREDLADTLLETTYKRLPVAAS